MGNSAKRDIRKADRADKMQKALLLRRRGQTYEDIGKDMGVTRSAAYKWVKDAISKIPQEAAKEVLQLELVRLDKMFIKVFTKAITGDLDAVHVALEIQTRRSKYLGLDAPKRTVQVDEELVAAMEKLRERLSEEEFARVVTILADVTGSAPLPRKD